MQITYQEAAYESEYYQQSLLLREKILRRPLGMENRPEDVSNDALQTHLVALLNNTVVATISIVWLDDVYAKLRQMGVDESIQGKGIGAKLMYYAHNIVKENGRTHITLNARASAVGFYKALGYAEASEPFEEIGIPHQKMLLSLR